jgi:hypothetical protein
MTMNPLTELEKILYISNELCRLKLTPKEFISGFLTKDHEQLNYRQRSWATSWGWTSTLDLVTTVRNKFLETQVGSDQWAMYIKGEVCISSPLSIPITY